mgnify:CR=1 FL=1
MAELLEMLAAFAYQYGIAGANMASMRGNHEGSVPEELIDSAEELYALSTLLITRFSHD